MKMDFTKIGHWQIENLSFAFFEVRQTKSSHSSHDISSKIMPSFRICTRFEVAQRETTWDLVLTSGDQRTTLQTPTIDSNIEGNETDDVRMAAYDITNEISRLSLQIRIISRVEWCVFSPLSLSYHWHPCKPSRHEHLYGLRRCLFRQTTYG